MRDTVAESADGGPRHRGPFQLQPITKGIKAETKSERGRMGAEQHPRGGSIPTSGETLPDLERVAKPFHLLKVEKLRNSRNR